VGLDAEAFRTAVMARIRTWSAEGVRHFSSLFLDLVSFAFQSAIMLVSLYFFLKDGHIIVKGLSSFVPLLPEDRRRLVDTLDGTVTATLHGGLSVAVVQGLVGGLAFWLLGLRAPVLWGTAMGFLAFVPVVGASLVWIPAAIYLFATGRLAEGITLVVVGALVISMIDYVLRPIIIGNRTRQHTLLILLSVLGGIQSFGFIGIVAGPMVVAFFAAMIEFFQTGASQPPPPGPAGPSTDTADAPP
jgi:predicted PurR-regulated permease PerM